MSWLSIYGPAGRIQAAYQHLDDLARLPSTDDSHPRTLDAKRADVALDHASPGTSGWGSGAGKRAWPGLAGGRMTMRPGGRACRSRPPPSRAAVPVRPARSVPSTPTPSTTTSPTWPATPRGPWTGSTPPTNPAPAPTSTTREGPGPYVPSEKLKAFLRVKHRTCIFPGCQRPSRGCHLDHTLRYPEGPTCSCNLAPLCVHHHLLKHHAPAGSSIRGGGRGWVSERGWAWREAA